MEGTNGSGAAAYALDEGQTLNQRDERDFYKMTLGNVPQLHTHTLMVSYTCKYMYVCPRTQICV